MTSPRRNWGLYLCRCSLPAEFDAAALQETGACVEIAPDASALPGFAARLRKAFAEHVLFACECTELERLAEACDVVGIAPALHPLRLRSATVSVHDPRESGGKAVRLVLSVMDGVDARRPLVERPLAVGSRVAIFSDRPAGLDLARLLPAEAVRLVFLEGSAEQFGGPQRGVNWGRPNAVTGHLGALEVAVSPLGATGAGGTQTVAADHVVVIGARAGELRRRTGVHLLSEPGAEALQEAIADIAELTGSFSKPEPVRYDAAICAGGQADLQACGRCIPACPYDAIERDPGNLLRIQVDQLACEGCGACTSACPTSALQFAEPGPAELYARLQALLAPGSANGHPAPAIVFHCEQQGRALLDWAAAEEAHYPARLMPVEVPCLRYVSEAAMLGALRLGAAGVALLGCEACPNGERTLLLDKLAFAQRVLKAFALEPERLRLIPVEETRRDEALQALRGFGEGLGEAIVAAGNKRMHAVTNRDVVADGIAALIAATGSERGGIPVDAGQPYARADVRAEGCTLCRACATVCPTHAFSYDEDSQSLRFKHIACVNCGLCERVCPERVISLRPELVLQRDSLEYQTVAQDEMVACRRCQKPFINRRALEAVEAKLKAAPGVLSAFSGKRAGLLRLCPDCRAVAAMLEVDEGWRP